MGVAVGGGVGDLLKKPRCLWEESNQEPGAEIPFPILWKRPDNFNEGPQQGERRYGEWG